MKVIRCIKLLHEALDKLSMATAAFDNITAVRDRPVRMKNGDPVTEANVTEFIKERTALHHHTWIEGPIREVLDELIGSIPHEYEARYKMPDSYCHYCGKRQLDKIHNTTKR